MSKVVATATVRAVKSKKLIATRAALTLVCTYNFPFISVGFNSIHTFIFYLNIISIVLYVYDVVFPV